VPRVQGQSALVVRHTKQHRQESEDFAACPGSMQFMGRPTPIEKRAAPRMEELVGASPRKHCAIGTAQPWHKRCSANLYGPLVWNGLFSGVDRCGKVGRRACAPTQRRPHPLPRLSAAQLAGRAG
jgi:hypothetical protein